MRMSLCQPYQYRFPNGRNKDIHRNTAQMKLLTDSESLGVIILILFGKYSSIPVEAPSEGYTSVLLWCRSVALGICITVTISIGWLNSTATKALLAIREVPSFKVQVPATQQTNPL